jgi:hypothetical protein
MVQAFCRTWTDTTRQKYPSPALNVGCTIRPNIPVKPVLRAVLFHGMEDSIYNLQTSTQKTKDLEHSELLRKCSGQGRTNDVTAPNCSGNPGSKSSAKIAGPTRRGHRRLDLVPAAITMVSPNLTKRHCWPRSPAQDAVWLRHGEREPLLLPPLFDRLCVDGVSVQSVITDDHSAPAEPVRVGVADSCPGITSGNRTPSHELVEPGP